MYKNTGLARVKKPVEKNRVFLLVFIGFFQRNFEKKQRKPFFFQNFQDDTLFFQIIQNFINFSAFTFTF